MRAVAAVPGSRLAALVGMFVVASCTPDQMPTAARAPSSPSSVISDAAHEGGTPGFYFLPPMVSKPIFSGALDANITAVAPQIVICNVTSGPDLDCGGSSAGATPAVAVFTTTSTPAITVDASAQQYQVNWDTKAAGFGAGNTYRVHVMAGAATARRELGSADILLTTSGGQVKHLASDSLIALQDGRTLPVHFRIETGIPGAITVAAAQPSIATRGGTDLLTATVLDLHGALLGGALVTWSSVSTPPTGVVASLTPSGSSSATDGTASTMLTAGSTSGFSVVKASSAGLSATVTVVVRPASMPVNLWVPVSSGANNSLQAVWASGPDVFAVGYNGTVSGGVLTFNNDVILHYNGTTWSAASSGARQALYAVWGTSASDVYTVGYNGVTLHYDGTSWNAMPTPPMYSSMYGIWGTSSSNIFEVGSQGLILHYDGTGWTAIMADGLIGGNLFGIWGSSGSDIYTVGFDASQSGVILHYDGTSWSKVFSSGANTYLFGVWGSSSADIYAVGFDLLANSAVILHYNGTSWSPMTSGISTYLQSVWGASSSDIFAAGGNGTILHNDGTSWSPMPTGSGMQLRGIWGTPGADVYAVSESDTTLLRGVRGATVTLAPASPAVTAASPTVQLTATAKDASNSVISGVTYSWSSQNTAVATVDANGLVTRAGNGTTLIIATAAGGGVVGSVTVTSNP